MSELEWADPPVTFNEVRFACTCGRFVAESSIRYEDYRDDGAYYGVGTRVEWDCSRCGTVHGEGSWEPPLVVVATRILGDVDVAQPAPDDDAPEGAKGT